MAAAEIVATGETDGNDVTVAIGVIAAIAANGASVGAAIGTLAPKATDRRVTVDPAAAAMAVTVPDASALHPPLAPRPSGSAPAARTARLPSLRWPPRSR